jgi:molybdenum-dependent oxidoreductase-like protein
MDAYRLRDEAGDEGVPVTRMLPRALVIPPGIPDFLSRVRFVEPGLCALEGRAWSGHAPIERVEVSDDGGRTWSDAELSPAPSRHAWSRWMFDWDATRPGDYELSARASDGAGNVQPVDQPWNHHGLSNNMVQRVAVRVGASPGS